MKIIGAVFGLFFLLVLSGCATLSKSQCQTGDWRSIGENDGRSGYSSARFTEHSEACTKHGIAADRGLYEQGRKIGLRSYCTPANAAKVGLAGRSYRNVCEGDIGLSFARIHRQANDVYSIDQDIEGINSEISTLTKKLADPATLQTERDSIASDIRFLGYDLSNKQRDRSREDAELRQVLLEEQARLSR
ncbi:DUF2799 domain-containing protein [Maritalea sp.]|uniref:DUF2799 domain-containing protein n=1 Tax=Maritalea sp. TaxID=2003361 RepID=UPI003EF8D8B5